MKLFLKVKLIIMFLALASIVSFPNFSQAKNTWDYPRLANYFLDTYLHPDEGKLLAAWDLLILSATAQEWRPEVFQTIRQANPDVIILAYISVSGVVDQPAEFERFLPFEPSQIPDSWWLKSSSGEHLGYWSGSKMLNVTELSPADARGLKWNDYLADFIAENVYATGYWDGIFLDEAFGEVSWLNKGDIDLNGDGLAESAKTLNTAWREGVVKIIQRLRERIGPNAYILVNGASVYPTYTNGRMFENAFKDSGHWPTEMNSYLKTHSASGYTPLLTVINANTGNSGIIDDQQRMFTLTSTLLGDGFFSYDFGDEQHMNIWWANEYDLDLGQAINQAQNIIGPNDQGFIPGPEPEQARFGAGLWRRDFERGAVLVNSTGDSIDYEVKLGGKSSLGRLKPFSGRIITFQDLKSEDQPMIEAKQLVADSPKKSPLSSVPEKDQAGGQALYQDKPVFRLWPDMSKPDQELGDSLEIKVTKIEPEIYYRDSEDLKWYHHFIHRSFYLKQLFGIIKIIFQAINSLILQIF